MSTHPEKKSERMEVRLGYSEKQAFVEACDVQGDTPSGAVRRFISGYTRRSTDDVMGEANRRLWRRYGLGVGIFAGVGAAFLLAASVWPLNGGADAVFSARDTNRDGVLDRAELQSPTVAEGIMRVLDLDSSGTINRTEFVRSGHMAYQMMDAEQAERDKATGMANPQMDVVRFTVFSNRIEAATYSGAVVNAGGLDRLVIWDDQGVPTVLNGNVAVSADAEMTLEADDVFVGKPVSLEMAPEN